MSEVEVLESQMMGLPRSERARLADRLLGSLSADVDLEWAAQLDREVLSRIEARKRGEIATSDGAETLKRMWALLEQ